MADKELLITDGILPQDKKIAQILEVYLQRGEQVLELLCKMNHDESLKCLKKREQAFFNLRHALLSKSKQDSSWVQQLHNEDIIAKKLQQVNEQNIKIRQALSLSSINLKLAGHKTDLFKNHVKHFQSGPMPLKLKKFI